MISFQGTTVASAVGRVGGCLRRYGIAHLYRRGASDADSVSLLAESLLRWVFLVLGPCACRVRAAKDGLSCRQYSPACPPLAFGTKQLKGHASLRRQWGLP